MQWYQGSVHGGVFFQYSNVLSQGISFLGFHQRLVFWNSIHQEVASGPFCLLVNSPWPLVFILCVFFFFLSGFNLYCWKGIHFSWSLDLNFFFYFLLLKLCYLYPSFGHLFIHYLLQV